ncbi:hypothetical protein [Pseudomonas sp. EpS/L25]|uniref:hypothetical protein n=1 Tax=Pseudomonas sp. EpS/L25 TaxID=1749078 RepID=UPI000743A29A|nr:hypothetical protein [Pseudomonas sp. EpS/L25]KUM42492.1 hypothetical protein AR540_01575 [Pseudomonas sp. EpS/L25]
MAAVDYLRDQGLSVRRVGMRVVIGPKAMITDDVRKYVKTHRLALLAELAANDGVERRCAWTVLVPGYRPFTMIGEPITHAEALADAGARWPGAEVQP